MQVRAILRVGLGILTLLSSNTIVTIAQAQPRVGAGSRVPLYFEENRGQTAGEVRFLARGAGYTAFLTGRETVFHYHAGNARNKDASDAVVRMTLAGSNAPSRVAGGQKLPGIVNYLIGNDPSRWRTRIPTYADVGYRGVYPGVDLVYRSAGQNLEFDFQVAPGADPDRIRLAYAGASKMHLNATGDLVLDTDAGSANVLKPVVYQDIDGKRVLVAANYRMRPNGEVGFQLGKYDHSRLLVIDPVAIGPSVGYATYVGGGVAGYSGIAVDPAGEVFLVGNVFLAFDNNGNPINPNFPLLNPLPGQGSYPANYFTNQTSPAGVVTALNASGTALLYSTYLSGNGAGSLNGTQLNAIAVDATGVAFVGGATDDSTFPLVKAFQTTAPSPAFNAAVVAELAKDGASLVYSSYLGGISKDNDSVQAIGVDGSDNAYVTGTNGFSGSSSHFPTTSGTVWKSISQSSGATNAFATKIAPPSGGNASISYSTLIGGSGTAETLGAAIAVDPNGNCYVAGATNADVAHGTSGFTQHDMTHVNRNGATNGNFSLLSAFVVEFNPTASAVVYLDYLGGSTPGPGPASTNSPFTFVQAIAVDSSGQAYVTGITEANNFETTSNAYQASPQLAGTPITSNGNTIEQSDAFVTVIAAGGVNFVYSTYLDGTTISSGATTSPENGSPNVGGIALGTGGEFTVAGTTNITNFPSSFPSQNANSGAALRASYPGTASSVAFVTKFSPVASLVAGGGLVYSVFAGAGGESVPVTGGNGGNLVAANGTDVYFVFFEANSGLASTGAYNTTTPGAMLLKVRDAVASGGTVAVTIASSPSGRAFTTSGTGCAAGSYTSSQTLQWTPGSSCTVAFTTPQANGSGSQFAFSKWEDNSTNASRSITAPGSTTTYTGTFNTQFQLTVATTGGGAATPLSGQFFNSGTVVNLQATPNPGFAFIDWTGSAVANSGNAATTITMNAAEAVTANFAPQATITSSPTGLTFSVSGTGCSAGTGFTTPKTLAWTAGSSCTVTFATPQAGTAGTQYAFSKWEDNSTNATRAISATSSPTTYTATFNTQYQLSTAASPSADGAVTPASGQFFNSGTVVNLQATPNTSFAFTNWTGSTVTNSGNAATTITMSAPASVTANFTPSPQATITSSPTGLSFSVTGTGCSPGTGYTTPMPLTWVSGSSCTVTFATPQAGTTGTRFVFNKWEDNSTNAMRVITAGSSTATYTASFNTQYQLTTAASLPAGGAVTPASGQFFNSGTVVNLQATPNTGFAFTGWTGSAVANSGNASTTIAMGAPASVIANFAPQATVTSSPTGLSFSVSGTGCSAGTGYTTPMTLAWAPGSTCSVAFAATQPGGAGAQFVFNQWENGSTNAVRTITAASAPATYTASFNTQYQLTTSGSPSADGSVTPASGQFYNSGTVVNLQASANFGFVFSGWTGSVANSANASTTVTMTGPQAVTATFAASTQQYVLDLAVTPANGGTISGTIGGQASSCSTACSAIGASGSLVSLTATPAAGYTFTSWTGCPSSSGATCTATLNGTMSISATFTASSSLTYTQSLLSFNRTTGFFTRTVTVTNSGAAISTSAYVADGLPAGVQMVNPSGTTDSSAPPAGSPYIELGPIGANSSVTATIQFSRTGTQAITYTTRILGAGPR